MRSHKPIYALLAGFVLALFLTQVAGAMLPCGNQLWPRFFYSGFDNGDTSGFVKYPPSAWGPGNGNRSYECQDLGSSTWVLSWVENGFGWTDHIFQASVQFKEGTLNNLGLIYHFQNPTNYYLFMLSDAQTASLMLNRNGTILRTESVPFTYSPDQWYVLRVEVQGNLHTARINGQVVLSWNDSTLHYGSAGLVARGTRAWFDNVISIMRPLP